MLSISSTFLTGSFCGTTPGHGSEWPPHPTRLIQALIASWFDGGCDAGEAEAIRVLESMDPPVIVAPSHVPEETYDSWVPMNSLPQWSKKSGKRPAMPKLTSARSSRFVGEDPIEFVWDEDVTVEILELVRDLCVRCTRLGTAESMVMLSVGERTDTFGGAWRPSRLGRCVLRTPVPGTLDMAKASASMMPGRTAPTRWSRYAWSESDRLGRMIVLGLIEGSWPVERALQLSRRLRQAVMSSAGDAGVSIPPMIHGHDPDGSPLHGRHVSFCVLPHVGNRFAHGSVIGASIVIPLSASDEQVEEVSTAVSSWIESGASVGFSDGTTLRFGPQDGRKTLEEETWCRPSRGWQTVVPMELPRHPVKRQGMNRSAWVRAERYVRLACQYEGLPEPDHVELSTAPFLMGSPHAEAMRGKFDRPLVHARVTFSVAVEGPLILGSSNHFGMGLMVPMDAS